MIKFGELRISSQSRSYIERALDSNWVSEGPNVALFEELFAQKFGYPHAIAVASGTDACTCCSAVLYSCGAQRGDEVIVPACTFAATASAVLAAGLMPRFVDVELETLNINADLIETAIRGRTVALFPVHLMGKPARMDKIMEVARAHQLQVIEDACEALGAQHQGKYVGTIGDMGCFSFYTAHLIVCGEGGMVVTWDPAIAGIIRSLRSHGRPPGDNYFDFQRLGYNAKMNDLEAAIGIGQLALFDEVWARRTHNWRTLRKLLDGLEEQCILPEEVPGEVVSPHAFWLVARKDHGHYGFLKLYSYLTEKGIECKTLFGSLPTQHRAFAFLGYKPGEFPNAEHIGRNGVHFGIHQYLSEADLEYIADTIRGFFRGD